MKTVSPTSSLIIKTRNDVPVFRADLAAYIHRHGISQREAAERLGVALRTLESWLGAKRVPQAMAIRALTPIIRA